MAVKKYFDENGTARTEGGKSWLDGRTSIDDATDWKRAADDFLTGLRINEGRIDTLPNSFTPMDKTKTYDPEATLRDMEQTSAQINAVSGMNAKSYAQKAAKKRNTHPILSGLFNAALFAGTLTAAVASNDDAKDHVQVLLDQAGIDITIGQPE